MRAVALLALLSFVAPAAEFGSTVNGIRVALSIDAGEAIVTIENASERDRLVPLGRTAGIREAEFVHVYITLLDGTRRQLLYTGGSGVAPGRLTPFLVPFIAHSSYIVRMPLRYLRLGKDYGRIEGLLSRGASLQAELYAADGVLFATADCVGTVPWSGRALSLLTQVRPK